VDIIKGERSMYVIVRTDGAYVSKMPGNGSSYTRLLQNARVFATHDAAKRDLCPGNERILSVNEAMGGYADG
jgi:hypothetical protein